MTQERLNHLIFLLSGVSMGDCGYSSTPLALALTLHHIIKLMLHSCEKFANVFPYIRYASETQAANGGNS